jgi:predicted lipoprotein with Yx(FWY)xxD motif
MRTTISLVAALAVAAAVVGAGSAFGSSTKAAASVTIRGSDYGRILFDGRGRALYAFTRDTARKSNCSGACARAWPPYLVTGRVRAGAGVSASLIGTIRRADGKRQVTVAGRPVYFYVGDRKPGQVLCQNVREYGGLWLVIRPNGRLVR